VTVIVADDAIRDGSGWCCRGTVVEVSHLRIKGGRGAAGSGP
jgi:hypothetical protein